MNINKTDKLKIVNGLNKRRCFKKAIEFATKNKINGVMITKKTIKKKFGLTEKKIQKLIVVEVDNPHYKCSGKMKLYLEAQVHYLISKKQVGELTLNSGE